MLFNVYAKQLIQEIKKTLNRRKIGMTVGREPIQMLRFVDIALITKNEKEMEIALEVMQKCFKEHDLKINWKKPRL